MRNPKFICMPIYKANIPQADFLMGAMRSMGYSFEAAISDIIDNSISASAKNISVKFPTDPTFCNVSILDDGIGLDKLSLFEAMKYGCSSCEEERDDTDLGRFGLGLKAASLSQCRVLTVASKFNGLISAYKWDYNFIISKKEWLVIELDNNEILSIPEIKELENLQSGTLVVWSDFDIIEKSSGDVFSSLVEYKVKIIDYLGLIFHRFLNTEEDRKIMITVNNHALKGMDPFLEKHRKTNQRQEFNLSIKDSQGIERHIAVQPFVLPFQKDLSKEDIALLGGLDNLRTKQGFYIYRGYRLIIWGTWFGLPKNELTKNARIRVDIPNSLDDIWNIDIKKQNASIPRSIKNSLKKQIQVVMEMATNVQTHRGRTAPIDHKVDYIWNRVEGRDKKYFYSINRNSNIFQLLTNYVSDEEMARFEMVLEEIERNIPYQQIYIDNSQSNIDDRYDEERLKDIEYKGIILVNRIVELGELAPKEAIDRLITSEPFSKHATLKSNLYQYFQI